MGEYDEKKSLLLQRQSHGAAQRIQYGSISEQKQVIVRVVSSFVYLHCSALARRFTSKQTKIVHNKPKLDNQHLPEHFADPSTI
jgi:hypothetical protein